MKARFSAEYTVGCSTCGTRKEIKMPASSGDLHFALASVDVAHSQARRWLIDHAKTCAGNRTAIGRTTGTAQHWGSTGHKEWCAFHRTVRIDPGGNAIGDCDCGAV